MQTDERIDALPRDFMLHAYRIKLVLGSGSFGVTYLVEHEMLETWHVIKEYLPENALRSKNGSTVRPKSGNDKELFDWGFKCFLNEAKLLHKLSHPHIIKVSDLFVANSTAYFVMPYLRGITLHKWMKKHTSPSQAELEAIFVPLIEGLKYIHGKGLLHRDIKPENIYILQNSHPILIDFGSARMAIGQKSKALTQVLTPGFAPIEQYSTKGKFTPALDLYSLAACMYMAITGEMPEEAPDRLQEDGVLKLADSQYKDHYSTGFLRAIDKSINLYAQDRHQNGFELQKQLLGQGSQVTKSKDVQKRNKLIGKLAHATDAKIEETNSKPSRKAGETWTDPHTGMEFVWVPGGCFQMGDIFGDGDNDEHPVHEVCIDDFWIGKYPVTQGQWMKVMDNNPSCFKNGLDHPVEQVSWHDVQEFINIMNSKSSTIIHRLPTEAEWEYAARSGGKKEKYAGGNDANSVAWYRGNSEGLFWKSTQPVGTKAPNGIGIYDMSGNVWEWVSDWYEGNYYSVSPRNNPQGPTRDIVWFRVMRGGCSSNTAHYCRTTQRHSESPDDWDRFIGFRLALSSGQ